MEGPKPRKGLEIGLLHRNFEPQDFPKGPIPTEKGAQRRGPFRVLGDAGAPAAHPVLT